MKIQMRVSSISPTGGWDRNQGYVDVTLAARDFGFLKFSKIPASLAAEKFPFEKDFDVHLTPSKTDDEKARTDFYVAVVDGKISVNELRAALDMPPLITPNGEATA